MSSARVWMRWSLLALCGLCLCGSVWAEDVEKKFRIGLGVGFLNQQDDLPSASANVLNLFDDTPKRVDQYRDPRNDSAAFGTLEIKSAPMAMLFGQYAVNKIFLVELSAGYQRADMGDVEVQAQFRGIKIPSQENFHFEIFRYPVGEVQQIPVQATFLARFRPRSSFNPYFGGGFGYTFFGFEPDPEFNQLSINMDASQGVFCRTTTSWFGNETLQCPSAGVRDLGGASVDVEDTWEWHIVGGAELSFKRHWVAFLDVRYSWSARQVNVSFDGEGSLGVAVPNLQDFCSNPPLSTPPGGSVNPPTVCPGSSAGTAALEGKYGAMNISLGGLVDGGRIVQRQSLSAADQLMYCSSISTTPPPNQECFVPEPDGQVDTGYYYAQGGAFKLDAFSLLIGVRYTF